MDLILALMPLNPMRTLHRPVRERVLTACLMATGLLATAISGGQDGHVPYRVLGRSAFGDRHTFPLGLARGVGWHHRRLSAVYEVTG
ncbi:uncharacterized protein K441DRAFT_669439 [Cenococcum geophilum 1.58]|uniref:Uncharacterized protein n=1 Tax=Cenococcum geophilum 1.58 TaxID=794803 RepID=A0ACC8EPH6_9PEZI|nr:hypothetical protein K441DRAFT_669439 [Cenococcum geophilum 1.58]